MKYIRTIYDSFLANIDKKPIIILYGARQVGKTTFVEGFIKNYKNPLFLQGDDPRDIMRLENRSGTELVSLVGNHDIVVIDEAQQIKNIGTTLKLMADKHVSVRIIATGSSSFELANRLSEPLTGRNRTFTLFPLSLQELVNAYDKRTIENNIIEYMTFGTYPEVVVAQSIEEKKKILTSLATDYLFKDVFQFAPVKHSFVFEKIVQLLALRVGSEISYTEIAKEVGISRDTLYNYVTMLEQAFIIFRLTPLYTNKTKEINKNHKIYFYDTGIRNAVLRAFDPLDLRNDKGAIFENFFIAEKIKERAYQDRYTEIHFWRTRSGTEIDFIECNPTYTEIKAYECKWKESVSMPISFKTLYPQASFTSVTKENIVSKFITGQV